MNAENKGKHQPERDIRDASNNQKVMLHATYSATSLSLNVDVLDADYVRGNSEDAGGCTGVPAGSLQTGCLWWGIPCKIENVRPNDREEDTGRAISPPREAGSGTKPDVLQTR